ncbi:ferredoxin reductase [Roseisolibacter agri]|uniref:ferredoxin reductase n=1 Tax=Roseisolibacter agri TaxID=2014610 RepID=UPI0024E15870|nr:ferredoxin reductase [Roseisolibacter agri]
MSSGIRAIPEGVPDVARRTAPARLEWRVATVVAVRDETPRARTLVLDVPDWPGHRAGQHVDVRLVAEDGYQAQRSYSIASAPEERTVALTVERLDDGEVSPYLAGELRAGDGLEVRGPIGGWFAWDVHDGGPLLLVAGGSGVVPLMAMLRHHAHADAARRARVPVRLLYSARTAADVIYRDELARFAAPAVGIVYTLTRETTPVDWAQHHRRIDRAMLDAVAWPAADAPLAFVCGPTPLVESVAALLVAIGHDPARVRTERFGPTGG